MIQVHPGVYPSPPQTIVKWNDSQYLASVHATVTPPQHVCVEKHKNAKEVAERALLPPQIIPRREYRSEKEGCRPPQIKPQLWV